MFEAVPSQSSGCVSEEVRGVELVGGSRRVARMCYFNFQGADGIHALMVDGGWWIRDGGCSERDKVIQDESHNVGRSSACASLSNLGSAPLPFRCSIQQR